MTTQTKPDIDSPYALSDEQITFFKEQGYIKLKDVLSGEAIDYYEKEISADVIEQNTNIAPMEDRGTYDKAFQQVGNIWTRNETVKEFVLGKRIGKIMAELMGVSGVRLYHDQALFKEESGGHTPWHADQYYWPFSPLTVCTAWIPLQATPMEMGPLEFGAKSHKTHFARTLEISDDSEKEIEKRRDFELVSEPFDLGEVSFHFGWTLHRAGPNVSGNIRRVMTIIAMDEDMILEEAQNKNQEMDRASFCPDTKVGQMIQTPMNPIIYSGK